MNSLIKTDGSMLDYAEKNNISLAQSFLSVDLIVVLDNSASMTSRDAPNGMTRKGYAKKQLEYIQATNPGKIGLVCFATDVKFSPGGVVLENVGGATNMADALKFVHIADDCDIKLLLISDGEPNSKKLTLEVVRKFKTSIDCLYCGNKNDYNGGRKFLQELSQLTGGHFFVSEHPGMIESSITKLLEE